MLAWRGYSNNFFKKKVARITDFVVNLGEKKIEK
jgi:hypothetical protein